MNMILSLLMLAGIAPAIGAVFAYRRGDRRTALLMLVASATMLVNVGIWTLPTPTGEAPTKILAGQRSP